jgi:CubicO group peptidase (beta-lactamase class C family)
VLFDEIHHGFVREPSLRTLLLGSPWGWAIVYALLVGAAYLAASGRRFGRPVPLREETARRSSAEYLESMAGLLRRGVKRAYVGQHYRAALKRRLARPLGVSPALDDAAFVAEVAAARPIDVAALRALLARLGRPDLSEADLLRLVAEADLLLDRR